MFLPCPSSSRGRLAVWLISSLGGTVCVSLCFVLFCHTGYAVQSSMSVSPTPRTRVSPEGRDERWPASLTQNTPLTLRVWFFLSSFPFLAVLLCSLYVRAGPQVSEHRLHCGVLPGVCPEGHRVWLLGTSWTLSCITPRMSALPLGCSPTFVGRRVISALQKWFLYLPI